MSAYWISWYSTPEMGGWELNSPWWETGIRCADEAVTICAAVHSQDEDLAKEIVRSTYDKLPDFIEWRFVESKPDDWSPFSGRFPQADWMKWDVSLSAQRHR